MENRMKVGIVTLVQHNDNYGGALQAFALQTALRKLGHDPFFANFAPERPPLELRRCLSRPIRKFQQTRRYRQFIPFWKKSFATDPKGVRSYAAFLKDPTPAEAYVCGSDQVWAAAGSADVARRDFSFLNFGGDSLKRVSYAPSFGTAQLSAEQLEAIKGPLARFAAISVREASSIPLVEACGRSAHWVADPTLLFDAGFWSTLCPEPTPRANACFFATYRWKTACNARAVAKTICRRLHCRLEIPCSETPFRFPLSNITIGPEEWVARIRDARFVLTNSFHCMVFAILFHKPFAVLALEGKNAKMNVRIESLTARLGLEDRIIRSDAAIDAILEQPIAWDNVDSRIAAWRTESWAFLKNAL